MIFLCYYYVLFLKRVFNFIFVCPAYEELQRRLFILYTTFEWSSFLILILILIFACFKKNIQIHRFVGNIEIKFLCKFFKFIWNKVRKKTFNNWWVSVKYVWHLMHVHLKNLKFSVIRNNLIQIPFSILTRR